jgi:hypothetical protein
MAGIAFTSIIVLALVCFVKSDTSHDENSFTQVCGCEVVGATFCNFDEDRRFCESCDAHCELSTCYDDGLPLLGAADCSKWCFPFANVTDYSATRSCTTSESVSTGVIVGVGIGVLLFVAIVAVAMMKGKKGSGDATLPKQVPWRRPRLLSRKRQTTTSEVD